MDTPEEVSVERNGVLERVDPYEVEIGETIVVKNGESIPIDGEIVFGEAFADAKALTGESVPYKIKQGDKVLSGVIVNGSLIKVKTSTLYENSTISKICDMVQNVSEKKSKSENFITKFAKYYTPIVVSLAFLTLIISLVFKIPFKKNSKIILVIFLLFLRFESSQREGRFGKNTIEKMFKYFLSNLL